MKFLLLVLLLGLVQMAPITINRGATDIILNNSILDNVNSNSNPIVGQPDKAKKREQVQDTAQNEVIRPDVNGGPIETEGNAEIAIEENVVIANEGNVKIAENPGNVVPSTSEPTERPEPVQTSESPETPTNPTTHVVQSETTITMDFVVGTTTPNPTTMAPIEKYEATTVVPPAVIVPEPTEQPTAFEPDPPIVELPIDNQNPPVVVDLPEMDPVHVFQPDIPDTPIFHLPDELPEIPEIPKPMPDPFIEFDHMMDNFFHQKEREMEEEMRNMEEEMNREMRKMIQRQQRLMEQMNFHF